MGEVRHLGPNEFDELIAESNTPVLVDFYAEWCGPCKMMAPVLDAMAERYAGRVEIVKVDVGDHPELATRFSVQAVPTLILFRDGQPVETRVGLVGPPELEAMFEEHATGSPAAGQ